MTNERQRNKTGQVQWLKGNKYLIKKKNKTKPTEDNFFFR